jgi:DMSO/TMAO reductase YedYZ molybdopterin-dependent catalytic subunit
MNTPSRRKLITTGLATAAGLAGLTAATRIASRYGLIPPDSGGIYGPGETLTYAAQRLLTTNALAREFPRSMISPEPFANTIAPPTAAFSKMEDNHFADWRLAIDGLVSRPLSLSLADLKSLPTRSQITEIACEEGWSYIAEWIGTPLSEVLKAAGMSTGVSSKTRYVSYFSIDKNWSDAIDMADALHPQTLIAWGMNGTDLPVPFGGPLRIRVPRQLGYKSVKQITRITVTDSLKWPPSSYSWYAGI